MDKRRVVITGFGVVSPLGLRPESLWDGLVNGKGGVVALEAGLAKYLTTKVGGIASEFTGDIENFGQLEKKLQRTIKKGRKLMCREIEMGVAAAQLAIQNSGLDSSEFDASRIGTIFGADHIMTSAQDFIAGMMKCVQPDRGQFDFDLWADEGLPRVEPLWLLKYLPNMPASHVAIYNDLRGPSNSITMRESSSNLAIGEALTTIRRGTADVILAGATGSRVHPMRAINTAVQEMLCSSDNEPGKSSRPFDRDRTGTVIGEGAGMLMAEEVEVAKKRGAKIWGEVLSAASSTVANHDRVVDYEKAFTNVANIALNHAGIRAEEIGHVNAHGLSSQECDEGEAAAIANVFGSETPVVTVKGHTGNIGAGGGAVEVVASLLAMDQGVLFPVLNYENHGVGSKINVQSVGQCDSPGDSFINLNITPQGQASAVIVKSYADR